jgi:hypothetical protein
MTPLNIALEYIARGWNPIPVPHRTKKPTAKGWNELVVTAETAGQFFNGQQLNIGVRLGETSDGLTDVDLDCPEALVIASYILPPTGAKFGRASSRASHRLYRTTLAQSHAVATIRFEDPQRSKKDNLFLFLELRIGGEKGAQTIFPGSTHVEGEAITWDDRGDPSSVDAEHLHTRVKLLAAACLFARYWPSKESHLRHEAALTIGGFLHRAGIDLALAKPMMEGIAIAAGDEERKDRVAAVEMRDGAHARGFPKLREMFGEKIAECAAKWLDYDFSADQSVGSNVEHHHDAPVFDPWGRYAVPAFPLETLPPIVREFVQTQSSVIGSDPSALAMAALVNISAALDHRHAVRMMRHGDWWEHPRLWVLLVGDPSSKKTPTISAAVRELEAQQNLLMDKHQEQTKLHLAALGKPEDGPPPPPRFVVHDSTPEKLGEILARHDRGLLVKRDELAGWIGAMEKYGGARSSSADRAFWLQAFDGGPYIVDRISRALTRVNNLSVSIIGGIQPARLAEIHGLTSDGLLQRFIPVMMTATTFPKDEEGSDTKYRLLTRRLLNLQPSKLLMADDAIDAMAELRRHLHDLEGASVGLADGFPAFVGKMAGYAGRLALVLHMAGPALDDPKGSFKIGMKTVKHVSALIREFILPHAFEFYRTGERASGGDRMQRMASWILTSGKTRIVASDLTSNIADLKGLGLWELNQRVSPMVAGGWLTANDRGPVTRSWSVSPGVGAQFRDRARDEEGRKARLAELMASPRKPKTGA